MGRWRLCAVFTDVLAGREYRTLGGVGLGSQRQVDRRLRKGKLAFGQAHVLDRVGSRGRDQQRLRIGIADVLGGQHDHPADDEPRVLSSLEHHREVIQRSVGVRAARGLDPGLDRVVVAIGFPVVEQCPPLQRVLGVLERDRLLGPGSFTRQL